MRVGAGALVPENVTIPDNSLVLGMPGKVVRTLDDKALAMLGMGYAAVPLYDLFCRVTGWGGATDVADAAPGAINEEVTVRFDASTAAGMPHRQPTKRQMNRAPIDSE